MIENTGLLSRPVSGAPADLGALFRFYRRELCENILPWWQRNAVDREYGGLFMGVDIEGGTPYLQNSDSKIWYSHCEALCGALMAFEVCREDWCLDWYSKTHNWSFSHFPDREHGEWTQRLDRLKGDGNGET